MPPVYQHFIAPARGTSQIWRIALGLMLIVGVYFAWMLLIGATMWVWSGLDGFENHLRDAAQASSPWALIVLLMTFVGGWIGVAITMRVLHQRRWRDLMGRAPVVLRDFVLGFSMMVVVGGILSLLMLPVMPDLQLQTPVGVWLSFLPLAILGILIQTGAEELVFRGYVQSHLAARFASPLIWMGVPTVLFGIAHFNPEAMGTNTWIIVLSTGLFGFFASDLTARTGSLGLAWGLHFANNVLAILIISLAGGLDGLALFTATNPTEEMLRPILLSDMALMTLVWIACRLWLRRR